MFPKGPGPLRRRDFGRGESHLTVVALFPKRRTHSPPICARAPRPEVQKCVSGSVVRMGSIRKTDSVLSRYGGHGPGKDFDGLFVSLGARAEAEAEVGGETEAIPRRQ